MQDNGHQYNSITFRGVRWLLLFVFYLQFLVPLVLESKWYKLTDFPMPDYAAMIAIQLFAVAVPCIVFLYLNTANPYESLKLKGISISHGIMCGLIGITAQSVASLLNIPMLMYISSKTGGLPQTAVSTPLDSSQLVTGLIVVALLPALFEEFLMRGIVLTSTQTKGYRSSLIISGLYFALLHNQIENFAGHFFLGFLLCYIVWMTQSVAGGIIAHFSFNAFGMVLDYVTNSKGSENLILGSEVFYWGVTIVSVLLFFLFIGTINRRRLRRNKSHKLIRQLIFSILNLPIILVVLGYILFQFVRYY